MAKHGRFLFVFGFQEVCDQPCVQNAAFGWNHVAKLIVMQAFSAWEENDTKRVCSHMCFLSGLRKSSLTKEVEGLSFVTEAVSAVHFPKEHSSCQRGVVPRPYPYRNQSNTG